MTEVEVVHTFTSKRLSEVLQLFDKGLSILAEDDAKTERNSKVKRDVVAFLTCCCVILQVRRMKASQTSLDSFLYIKSVRPGP
jgi:hypothetical protein